MSKATSSKDLEHKFRVKCEGSGISSAQAKKLGFQLLTAEAAQKLGHKKVPAFKIPYFTLQGKASKFYRLRYLETTKSGFARQTDAKDQRYDQPKGITTTLYVPPLLDWAEYLALRHRETKEPKPLFFTEGELKGICMTLHGYPTIALGGVWNFCSRHNGVAILPIFDELDLEGRACYIVFDADAAINPSVVAAENEFCRRLLDKRAVPYVVRIPALPDIKKTGIDDLLTVAGKAPFEEALAKAQLFKLAEALHAMNEKVTYIRQPSLVLEHGTYYKMSVNTFKNEVYANNWYLQITPDDKVKRVRTAEEWVAWEGRAEAERFVYEPGQPLLVDGRCINMWKGLAVEPKKGDVKPWHQLMDYVFADEPEARRWFEQWLAYPLQHPGTKLFTAAVIYSVIQGTGKTLIGHTMQRIYGDNSIMIGKEELASGDNSFAENKQFVVGDEITGDDKRGLADSLKSLITNEELRINIKYVPTYSIRSCINYYFTSNNPDAFLLDDTDRRYFVHEIRGEPLPSTWYSKTYDPWYKSADGAAALLYYLLHEVDTSDFEPKGPALMTEAKKDMIADSRSTLAHWVRKLKEDPDTVLPKGAQQRLWATEELLAAFDADKRTRFGVHAMGTELRRALVPRANEGMNCTLPNGKQKKLWIIRDVEELSKLGGAKLGKLYQDEWTFEVKAPKFAAKKGGGK